ncbi:MAG: response regulator transcription factor [Phyllobacterium sp.]|uniref:helix-turn-helix domain-containing protein n=1 Tax=Phyllobacterium sp. TaxID=1871046 RepID=UPI0030EFF64E
MSVTVARMRTDQIQSGSQTEGGANFKSGILIYAEAGVVFQGLVQSLERTFPDLKVDLSNKLAESGEHDDGVGLVMIHADFVADLVDCVARCKMRFPDAYVTLMIDDTSASIPEFNTLFDNKLVQGLLPFSLKLDAWLAVVWLMLNGGEYYPSSIVRSMAKTANGAQGKAQASFSAQPKNTSMNAWPVKTLTLREHEILQLLSEGLQNKIIADRLALSVHTVKVHVHNLIRKLRAHNRTQATAIYRDSMEHPGLKPFDATVVH